MTWRLVCVFLIAWVQVLLAMRDCAYADGPFVAGFERFGRHAEIEKRTSGKLLIRELSCTACHASEDAALAPKSGPNLEGAAVRLNQAWMSKYIARPHTIKRGTTMPDVLGDRSELEREKIAESIAAFLTTLDRQPDEVKGSGLLPVPNEFWSKGDAVRGRLLYHQVGCVACHAADTELAVQSTSAVDQLIQDLDADELAKLGLSAVARAVPSVPLGDLTAKYTVVGLTHFLLDPMQFRPSGRMPALKLSPVESADIASYLLENREETVKPANAEAEIARGRQLFAELKCIQCHAASNLKPQCVAKPLKELSLNSEKQCVTATTSINYQLDGEQLDVIRAALSTTLKPEEPLAKNQLELQLLAFNCYACHERDGRGGVARFRRDYFETVAKVDLGDEGRLPPPLTGVGGKLQPTWFKNVLIGKKADVRPHMQIRMPVFHSELASQLSELFRDVDQVAANKLTLTDEAQQIEVGRQLIDVGCVQCHSIGGNTLPGVIGVDLRSVSSRLQSHWFHEFLLNPSAIKNRTRMPAFFLDGKSQRPDLLDGNVDRQIAAIWAYLNSKESFVLPDKIKEVRARNFELQPTDKPIVLRTFMKDAGTHAIAVGFSQQLHYAFDSEKVRMAIGWRGNFMDAQGTWFIRSAPPAEPLGSDVVHFDEVSSFAQLADANQSWPIKLDDYRFSGYRLDALGVPSMLYRFGDIEIEDRIAPADREKLARVVKLRSDAPGSKRIWFMAAADKQLTRINAQSHVNHAGLKTTLVDRTGMLRNVKQQNGGERDEWLVPIEFETAFELELHYQW
jgi:mono/diheme cytochrome c family protein